EERKAEPTPYYEENHLRANPSKTQVCAFHLRNREAKRQLKVSWSGTSLEHCEHPVYLGVTLDRCLSFKTHTEKTKCKVRARNNIIRKLTGTTWGANPQTLKSTALALCYSAAEYACLPSIAPPEIRRNAASKKERQQQSTDQRHPLVGLVPKAALNPGSFLKSVPPLGTPSISSERVTRWEERLDNLPSATTMELKASEALPPGADTNYADGAFAGKESGAPASEPRSPGDGSTRRAQTTCVNLVALSKRPS
ncbi:hypothetical protein KUCAC02_036858, partial [Chaenocephalus aceratus]